MNKSVEPRGQDRLGAERRSKGDRYLRPDLERLAKLDERVVERLEVERRIAGVRDVAAPEAYVEDTFPYAHLGVQRPVETLIDVVALGPVDFPGSAELRGGG